MSAEGAGREELCQDCGCYQDICCCHEEREQDRQARAVAMEVLRAAVKARTTYRSVARACRKHPSTVGDTLRGNYPYRGACLLPKYLWVYLREMRYEVPDELCTYLNSHPHAPESAETRR